MKLPTTCALCLDAPAEGKGEHVWPSWYLRFLDLSGRPRSPWSSGGEPLVDRRGQPIHPERRQRVLLPACLSCNNELNRRFEVPAKTLIKRLAATNWVGHATAEEWRTIGLWFAKVLLLLGHPSARYEHPVIDDRAVRFRGALPTYHWLVNGGPPPASLSLWVFNASEAKEAATWVLPVPRTVYTSDGLSADYTFLRHGGRGLSATLLEHPGWPVDHPLVASGQAWELIHSPHAGDLSSLPPHSHEVISWRSCEATLKPDRTLGDGLPPLQGYTTWPVVPEMMDVCSSVGF